MAPIVLATLVILALFSSSVGQVLTPPYFNLAEGRRITATATCGEDVDQPELYCKLVGADWDSPSHFNVIQGQFCDFCDPNDPESRHPPEDAIDGSERWWQSPPLSRGMNYNAVNLTIDLGQLFQVAYVVIKMANSPRPGIWVLERSVDKGISYSPWQYFAENDGDCERFFGKNTLKYITQDDDVVCTTRFSKVVPLEGGEIFVSMLNDRPSAKNFFNSSVLQEFTRATNVRLRLLRTKTLLGHLMSVERQDPTVTRRYFYSIKDISIGGRCVCNGHASVCDIPDPDDRYQLRCRCQHHTCGSQCEECCPGFIQKLWRSASYAEDFVCEPCNCHDHSNECIYDEQVSVERGSLDIYGSYEGGGVCQNCQHNTKGINCDSCIDGYYKPYERQLNDTEVCQPCQCQGHFYTGNCFKGRGQCECKTQFLPPLCDACNDGYYDYPNCKLCDCHKDGTEGGICEVGGGQCPCKINYIGTNCDKCAPGYYNFPECEPCNCARQGVLGSACDVETGQCRCINNYGGQQCDRCEHGYFDYSTNCSFCRCDSRGTVSEICDKEVGNCLCSEGYSGERCDNNAPGFWGYPSVQTCDCHERGSPSTICDTSGKCSCLNGYSGRTCGQCSPGYFNFPDCETCNCDQSGSFGISCSSEGKCVCHYNFDGIHCDRCKDNFYNFPLCEECNCHPAGVLETFSGCGNAPVGELCECKERVTGRICNQCHPLYWNLSQRNQLGCEECNCYSPGVIGALSTCDMESGQCSCKANVDSQKCDRCSDGSFNLMEDNIFGCSDCQCNIGGSVNNNCNKVTGQCQCRYRVEGQRCDVPMQSHYFPTLFQEKYEAEDGRTPQNTPVRFGYDESIFPGYSWRGYAVYSQLQKETLHDVYISKPSLYRLIFYYMNPSNQLLRGIVSIDPENTLDDKQEIEVIFHPTSGPKLFTVSTLSGFPLPFVLNPGAWTLSIENAHQNLFIDYFVLLPLPYYEATILSEVITAPCQTKKSEEPCLHFAYPEASRFNLIYGSAGYVDANGTREAVELFHNQEVLSYLNSPPMAWLSANQQELQFDIRLREPGQYVILLNYFTPEGTKAINIEVTSNTNKGIEQGRAVFYDCSYSWPCRQVVQNLRGEVGVYNFDSNFVNIVLKTQGEPEADVTIHSVMLVPLDEWNMKLIEPKPVCTKIGDHCIDTPFVYSTEAAKVEFEDNFAGKSASTQPPGVANTTTLVFLNASNAVVDIRGSLRSAGHYKFVVHYYQPKYTDFSLAIMVQNGVFLEGTLPIAFCPSTSGCRANLQKLDGTDVFNILENFVLTLTLPTDEEVWLDYVMVIPVDNYSPEILSQLPRDKTEEFFEKCGRNHFSIDESETGFCRESAFALTSSYNNGALPCQCNFEGSVSFECDLFGGQCSCKRNVIGRECNRCKTGYFGFPDCRPCDCPSTALCDPITGECICPPRVIGERCERCALNTYGFDPIIGCEECRCNEIGVLRRELQCNLNNGQCLCKENVVGKRCERCEAGYWSFPFCQLCNCDIRGTEDDICSQSDATCFCKANTGGRFCDICESGTYNIEEANPDGCTKCFCFGKSQFCSSSYLSWGRVPSDNEWKAVNLKFAGSSVKLSGNVEDPINYPTLALMNLTQFMNPEEEGYIYFSAPKSYLGSRIQSYGGKILFKILTISSVREMKPTGEPDLVLTGSNATAFYFYDSQVENSRTLGISIELQERNFRTQLGVHLRREQFMMLLKNLDGLFVRAQYDSAASEARVSDFEMETAVADQDRNSRKRDALSVELCQCPPNYRGSSCEDCAAGFFRANAGPFGGFCVPCQCNNHADTCDAVTGICIECKDNTIGNHCEECIAGFFGNALKGTPHDCLICSCPMPTATNNFATSCSLRSNKELICQCKNGYSGQTCGTCAPGYYGRPKLIGDFCQPCECNSNIDATSPYACDDISGMCLLCLNDSYGNHCERCAPGFYGDAVLLKNCQSCSCDECGTNECNHYTGICECHPNVIGDSCDKCATDYWGFASCQGCHQCNCDEASVSRQCEEETGQCICKEGVTGQRCDRCMPGYWKYTEFGCTKCECRTGFSVGVGCDPIYGHCSCLPGVIGDNCEGCPERWVLVEGRGCQECDDCVHDLLDTTDELSNLIDPVINEYESAAQSFFLHQRLQVINESVKRLRPKVDAFDLSEEDLKPVDDALDDLFTEAIALSTKAELLDGRATKSNSNGQAVRDQATEVLDSIQKGYNFAQEIVDEINYLVIGLETGRGAQIESAIKEAEEIIVQMKKINLTSENDKVREDIEIAEEFLDRIRNLSLPGVANKKRVDESVDRLVDLEAKINEMHKLISESRDKYNGVRAMNHKSRLYGLGNLKKKYSEIEKLGETAVMQIKDAENFTNLASEKLGQAEQHYFVLDSQYSTLMEAHKNLNSSVFENTNQYGDSSDLSDDAVSHARDLENRADELDDMLADTRHVTQNALNAANANDNIVSAIENALKSANAAANASDQALEMSGISESASNSVLSAESSYGEATTKINLVEDDLVPDLHNAREEVTSLEDKNRLASGTLDTIHRKFDHLGRISLEERVTDLQKRALEVTQQASDMNDRVSTQYKNLEEYAENVRRLSTNIKDAERDNKFALDQVKNVEKLLPKMKDMTDELINQKNIINERLEDVGSRLERLRRTITKTRERTNKIKVGIDFEQGSVLELKNPEDLSDTATSTELSVLIKTNDDYGLPLFLGTPVGGSDNIHRTLTDDFMAIEIVDGYVQLTMNLGAGAHPIRNNQYVADNEWHKIHIKRIGKVIQLSVSREDKDRNEVTLTVEEVLPGTFSILNLDPKVSKLYVGGIPTGVDVDPALSNTYYTGQMEDLWLNKKPIGLWNFVNRGSTDFPLNGAKERLVLKETKSNSHIVRFDGSGYMAVSTKGHETTPELSIVLSFKSYVDDALLFLLQNGENEYVSLEMRGGKVRYQHRFRRNMLTLLTDGIYNDDEWHTIEATRVAGDAVMKIDGTDFQTKRSMIDGSDFTSMPEVMYLGGYPGEHDIQHISNDHFRGCIKDVKVTEVTVDFARSTESIGTISGCKVEEVGLVSFHSDSPGYIKLPSAEGSGLQLVFKFKTENPNGLLFYTETRDRTTFLSLSLVDGALVLRSAPGGDVTTGSYTKYNDSEWHIVIATRENKKLRLHIDDFEKPKSKELRESLPLFDGPVYFGGIPIFYPISISAASGGITFFGCIGDATLNGKIIDFSSAAKNDRPGSMLETCSLTKKRYDKSYDSGIPELHSQPKPTEPSAAEKSDAARTSTAFATDSSAIETTTPQLESCALPVKPAEDTDIGQDSGIRFGTKRDTRIEYDDLPGSLRGDFSFSVDFKTWSLDGIIFYAANMNHRDFVSLYMSDGKIVFNFSPGSSPAIMRSVQRYNNNQWHKLVAHRTGDFGRLEIDGFIVANGTTYGDSKHIEAESPYYFGGLNSIIVELAKDNTEQTLLSFNGCLKGFRMNNMVVAGRRLVNAISECSDKVEPGVFFSDAKLAHAVVRLKFNVGLTFDMSLDIKPRKTNGVIMSVHGRRDFILLQLKDGKIELKVDNGKGIVIASYNFTSQYHICDGQWHSIQVLKNKHVLVLSVDGVSAEAATGMLGASSADTNNPLFLGSQPRLGKRRGSAVKDKYVGCIRNVSVNGEHIDLAYTLFVGDVIAGVCPVI